MAVFKAGAQRARLDAENAERDARVLSGRKAWLTASIKAYIDYYGRNSIDEVNLPGLLDGLGIDPDQFGEREDG